MNYNPLFPHLTFSISKILILKVKYKKLAETLITDMGLKDIEKFKKKWYESIKNDGPGERFIAQIVLEDVAFNHISKSYLASFKKGFKLKKLIED